MGHWDYFPFGSGYGYGYLHYDASNYSTLPQMSSSPIPSSHIDYYPHFPPTPLASYHPPYYYSPPQHYSTIATDYTSPPTYNLATAYST